MLKITVRINKFTMKNNQSFTLLFLFVFTFISISTEVIAQKNTRMSFQISPLCSYLNADFGHDVFYVVQGIKEPQLGFSSAVKFEVDLDNRFSVSTGLTYEIRNNSYKTDLYDTTATYQLLFPMPYHLNSEATYHFIGIPIALNVNYLKNSSLRIYQSFGTQFSFLVSSRFKGMEYWEKEGVVNYSRKGNSEDINNVIVSLSSSIAVCKYISKNIAFKIEPGVNYMVNNFWNDSFAKEKFFDLKVDVGIIYNLNNKN